MTEVAEFFNDDSDHTERRKLRCLQSHHCATVFYTYAQVARAQLCANHVQHIERLSLATCVPRGGKGQVSYNVWQSWNHICLSFILLAETISQRRRGGKWSTQRKPLTRSFRKCYILESLKIQAPTKTQTRTLALVTCRQAKKADMLTIASHVTPHPPKFRPKVIFSINKHNFVLGGLFSAKSSWVRIC